MIANSANKQNSKTKRYESNINRRRMQRGRQGAPPAEDDGGNGSRADDNNNDAANTQNPPNMATAAGGNSYGDYGAYTSTTNTATGGSTYGSYGGGGGSAFTSTSTNTGGGYDAPGSYTGNSGGSSSYGGGSSSYGGGSSSYGGSSIGGSSSYGGSSYGSDSYSSAWGTGAASSSSAPSSFSSKFSKVHAPSIRLSLLPAILLLVFVSLTGMLATAHQMEHDPEGTFANCCRVSLHTANCIYKVVYNLYHCRLGDIPQVVFASELEEDEYTDEEIERMRLRPGIERALDIEHRKALRKVGIEMNKIKVTKTDGSGVQSARNTQR
eukprot:CAMPEP_0172308364 /NCGR_PEP_ID=MMETSP1058-20130122/8977_1 /TAXON_ID=83371 /ORGANISM="Detonula confervacea, Strain CCMP 353" /LENGTH=323 /DNA_ID=CAMNT_0013020757 /DNA_START=437 /DNA_END=1408 /DNA_ORIENTATION=+